MWKSFTLEFINNFASLFYIAFAKEWAGPILAQWLSAESEFEGGMRLTAAELRSAQCFHNNCLYELGIQLAMTMFVRSVLARLAWIGYGVMRLWMKSLSLIRIFHSHTRKSAVPVGLKRLQYESHLQNYADVTKEYQEVAIMYGYIVLFAAAFPAAPILALFVLQVELRTDAYKICMSKRPPPRRTKGIGNWYNCFEAVTNIAVFTNVGLICFTAKTWIPETYSTSLRVIAFIVAEHALFFVKFSFQNVVADEASASLVRQAQHGDKFAWLHRVIKYKLFGGVRQRGKGTWLFPAPDPNKLSAHCEEDSTAYVPPGKGCLSRGEMRRLRLDQLSSTEDKLVRQAEMHTHRKSSIAIARQASMKLAETAPLQDDRDIFRGCGLEVVNDAGKRAVVIDIEEDPGAQKKVKKKTTLGKTDAEEGLAGIAEQKKKSARDSGSVRVQRPKFTSLKNIADAELSACADDADESSQQLVGQKKKKGGLIVL